MCLRYITTIIVITVWTGGLCGCTPPRRPAGFDAWNRAFTYALWDKWKNEETHRHAATIKEACTKLIEDGLEPVQTALQDVTTRLTAVEKLTEDNITHLLKVQKGFHQSLNTLTGQLRGVSPLSTVKDVIATERKASEKKLAQDLVTASKTAEKKIVAAVARLDALEQGQRAETNKREDLKTDLEKRLTNTETELKSDATTAREALRSDMLKPTVLRAPMRTVLDDWQGTNDIAALKAHNQTLRYVLGALGALGLGGVGLALRPRNQKRLAQAEEKAEMPKRRTSRAKKKDAGG